jgi:hypothetical protein
MGTRREGYHGGEFLVFKREAARTDDFCCICDYRAREGLPTYTPTRMFHAGEQIAFIRFAGTSESWDRAHSVCATKELAHQEAVVDGVGISVHSAPVAYVRRLVTYERRLKYQVVVEQGDVFHEVMRFSVEDEAIGAAKLINDYDSELAQRMFDAAAVNA